MPYMIQPQGRGSNLLREQTETFNSQGFRVVDVDARPLAQFPGWAFVEFFDDRGTFQWGHTPEWNLFESAEAAERMLTKWCLQGQFPRFPESIPGGETP